MKVLNLILILAVIILCALYLKKCYKIEGLDLSPPSPMRLTAPSMDMKTAMTSMSLEKPRSAAPPDACDYLLNEINDGDYASQVAQVCQSYKTKCGESSLANEIVYLSENTEIEWPDASQDLLQNFKNDLNTSCAPKMPCSVDDPCPSFLTCFNGTCG